MKRISKYIILAALAVIPSILGGSSANATTESDGAKTAHIIYHDNNGTLITRDAYRSGYTFDAAFPQFYTGLKYRNTGWNTKADGKGTTYKTGEMLSGLTEDLDLYPMLEEGFYIRFASNGGTPIQYQFVISGEKVVKPTDPTRSGYTFGNWYSDEACTNTFDFNTVVTADMKLYAKWTAAAANYTVRIWLEKAEHSGTTTASDYTYYGSFQKAGTTEGAVSFNNTAGSADMNNSVVQAAIMSHTSPDNFPLFFNDDNGNSNALTLTNDSKQQIAANGGIAGDGSTVFNVYFRRIYLNYTLDDGDVLGDGHFKETHQMRNGESVKAWLQRYNISVKQSFMNIMSQSTLTLDYQFMQSIYNLSSVALYSTAHDVTCLTSACNFVNMYSLLSDAYKTSLVDNIGWEQKLKSSPKGKNQFDIQYFYETVESALAGNETDFTKYKESDFYKGSELLYNRPDANEWDGFSFSAAGAGFRNYFIQSISDDGIYGKIRLKSGDIVEGKPMEWNYGTGSFQSYTKFGQRLKFYYTRILYSLSFVTNIGSITIPSISLVYGEAIKNHKDAVKYTDETGEHYLIPDETTYRDDEYVIWIFKGWYAKSDFSGEPIDIATTTMTMPSSPLTLYAKWEPKTITVTYDGNGGKVEGKDKTEKQQLSGQIPVRPADPEPPEGMLFSCWTSDGRQYDFTEPITVNTELKALYYSNGKALKVTYDYGEGTGTVPVDTRRYLAGANPEILSPAADLVPPIGQKFSYWTDSEHHTYIPGDDFIINDDTQLTAVYAEVDKIIIKKEGLKFGESAAFSIYDESEPAKVVNVILTGVDNTGSTVSQIVAVEFKTKNITVKELPWSWAYNANKDVITKDVSKDGNVFTFTNIEKENTPIRDEAIKNNAIINAH